MASGQHYIVRDSKLGRPSPHSMEWPDEASVSTSPAKRCACPGGSVNTIHIAARLISRLPVPTNVEESTKWQDKTISSVTNVIRQTVHPTKPTNLAEAVEDLEDLAAHAEEIEVETPSQTTIETARRLLEAMCHTSSRRFSVYPMDDGKVAIDARGRNQSIVMVICRADGSVLCLVNTDGNGREALYQTAQQLPDDFIRQALAEL